MKEGKGGDTVNKRREREGKYKAGGEESMKDKKRTKVGKRRETRKGGWRGGRK